MKLKATMAITTLALLSGCVAEQKKEVPMTGIYNIEAQTIGGKTIKLEAYKDKVLLIVNTASKCGFTSQYDGLQKLYEAYEGKGFVVLGFPSNDFLKQEPGSNEEIASFCKLNYGVTFPLFQKVVVKGKDQHPLYRYLTSEEANPGFGGKISWNFNKFLINREGKVVGRFGSRTKPNDKKLVEAIKTELAK
ncbi:glutathione peroxidase [Pontiella sulfatireligans]|uniref:Glutathione peroxidase n=1 Tax=Pontiella sulfatireligans TaxID=2750658 RepID=A0A6C2UPG4_9BACT|nr:glutathione peroxidase [Pontiella sulfatireligans]VGO21161.1 Glutathione peroxidase BsaA [Pontiella sulfatireligans]